MPTLFERIIAREIPAQIVYEDEQSLAFRDIHPHAPTHVLIIPKKPISSLATMESSDAPLIGHLFWVAHELANQLGLTDGFRVVINTGSDGGQTVDHLHLHLLAGRALQWPPG